MVAFVKIPDGPLHPDDAVIAMIVGLVVGGLIGRHRMAAPVLVLAAGSTLAYRQPALVPEGIVERPAFGFVVMVAVAVAAVAGLVVRGVGLGAFSFGAAVAGCAAVWAIAPDTEPPLIAGAVLLAAWPTLGRAALRWAPVALLAPPFAAVIGTVGRPERTELALGAATAAMAVTVLAAWVVSRVRDGRQRAGTPTTVAPAATSSVTTAPAATTAP